MSNAGLTFSRVLSIRAGGEVGTPDLLALAQSRALDPEIFDTYPPFMLHGEISSNRWDAYDTRMGLTTLRNYAESAAQGVAFLQGHGNHESPIGHTLTGRYVGPGGNGVARVTADMYALPLEDAAPFVQRLRAGVVRDLSVGFSGGEYICSICGKDFAQWMARQGCPHILGMIYTPAHETGTTKGEPQKARATIENAALAEVSGVYDGACPGAMIAKARAMVAEGLVSDAERELVRVRYRLPDLPGPARFWNGVELGEGLPDSPAPDRPETATGGAMDDRATSLPEPVLSRLRGAGMPQTEPDPVAWVERELTRLRPLADDGRAYRADLVAEALAEGVRAHGTAFDQEMYRGLLETAPLPALKKMRDDWRTVADTHLSGSANGRVTQDQAPPPETAPAATAPTHFGPAGAYRA